MAGVQVLKSSTRYSTFLLNGFVFLQKEEHSSRFQ